MLISMAKCAVQLKKKNRSKDFESFLIKYLEYLELIQVLFCFVGCVNELYINGCSLIGQKGV